MVLYIYGEYEILLHNISLMPHQETSGIWSGKCVFSQVRENFVN